METDERTSIVAQPSLRAWLSMHSPIARVEYADDMQPPEADLVYRVPFPRLELVLEGGLAHAVSRGANGLVEIVQHAGTALYVPPNSWNLPRWIEPATTLSLLFGKQKLGFSVTRWDGRGLECLDKQSIARLGPRAGSYILLALGELGWRREDQATACLLVQALISHACDQFERQRESPARRSTQLFQAIREHVDSRYAEELTREAVARSFHISQDHLSHLFQKEAHMSFNDYLVYVRMEQAKVLLKQYDMKIKEVAHRCGFNDSNYFIRLFRKRTDRTPTEYRAHYRSRLI